ncbi:MAG: class I SAM-dependent methyltransferase [Kineosporiaceae bacterium]
MAGTGRRTRADDVPGAASGLSFRGDARALSFGERAAAYEAHRPGYPPEVVRWLLEPAGAAARVLDVGAGTGKLTRVVAAAGHAVTGVDPDPGMLAELRTAVPGVRTLEGTGEAIPVDDGAVDAVTVAQAWHWMDHPAAAAEFARVLRPGGVVGLVWNVLDPEDAMARRLAALTGREDVVDRARDGELVLPHGAFGPGEAFTADNSHTTTVDELVALVATWSWVARGPDPGSVLERVRGLAAEHADGSGTLQYRLRTRAHRFARR